jgi:predicted metallopeptidase
MARKRVKYAYEVAPDVQRDLEEIVRQLPGHFTHVDVRRVVCYRSRGSTARIYARIWSLPGIWQAALGVEAHYVIEVVERYDRSTKEEQEKTLIHELLHIPKTFSGALVPHNCFGKNIDCAREGELHRELVAARGIEARARLAAKALYGTRLDAFGATPTESSRVARLPP